MTADLEPLDRRDRRVRRETQVRLDLLAPLEMTGSTAPEDHLDLKERRANLESKEVPDQGDPQVLRVPRVIPEHLVSLATQESRVPVVSRASLVILETMAGRETGAFRAILDLRVNLDYKDLLENL